MSRAFKKKKIRTFQKSHTNSNSKMPAFLKMAEIYSPVSHQSGSLSLTWTALIWALTLQCPWLLSLFQHENLGFRNLISCSWEMIKGLACFCLCSVMSDPLQPHGLYSPPDSSVHGILQAIILEWVAIPFSRRSSQPRDRTQVSCTVGGFFTVWATREALMNNTW